MKQLTEDYVSFETAKLLKEKGFDIPCRSYYNNNDYLSFEHPKGFVSVDSVYLLRPTHQMALKWLRENNLYIEIRRNLDTFYFRWKVEQGAADKAVSEYKYDTYEEAVEAACLYVLKNLI